jgi:hypothetical protein
MEIQTKHRLKILNSKCEYVCAVENLSKKLDYGDDIECCLNKLFLASKLINRLECYNFPTETTTLSTNSEFYTELGESQADRLYRTFLLDINLNINGTIYNIVSDGVNIGITLIINKLTQLGVFVFCITSKESLELTFGLTCDILDISFNIKYGETEWVPYTFANTVPGVCGNPIVIMPKICIEQSDLREMYAVLDNLLS